MKQLLTILLNIELTLKKVLISLLFCIPGLNIVNAQITVSTTDISGCGKSDGKAEVNVTTSATGFVFEYSKDGTNFQPDKTFTGLSAGNYTATVRDKNTQCAFKKDFTIKSPNSSLKVTISGNNGPVSFLVCESAPTITLNASASGGSGSYDYTWPGGTKTVSSTGSYSVTATDTVTKCTDNASVFVIFIPIICSRDPNDIVGPEGYGPGKMIAKSKQHSYIIRFENDPDFATAPAQVVKINHPLDDNVNPFSLRVGDFGFGGMTFTVPQDKTYYATRLNLVDSLGVVVDVTAGIDAVKKEAFWIFESKDPETGLPPANASLGFLPVNDSSAKGEGFVSYLIKAAEKTITGDTIHAKASIVFDINEPIETPAIFNTIDAVAPVSKVNSLVVSQDSAAITINWSGQDDPNGSGVRDYDVYVSQNNGAFSVYQAGITDTTTTFTGTKGNTYCFYTRANDNVGNQESIKNTCEASIKLGGEVLPVRWLYVKGQQTAKDVLVTWATTMEVNTKHFVIERSFNGREFTDIGTVTANGSSSQTNNYQFVDKEVALLNINPLYYRLRQVDADGSKRYSVIIPVSIRQGAKDVIVKAYPNPFVQNITLEILNITATREGDHVALYTLDGKRLYTRKIKLQGNSTVLLNDLPSLRQGIYLLKASIAGKMYTIKMIRR